MTMVQALDFELDGSKYRRTISGFCFKDGRRVTRVMFNEARNRYMEQVGKRLALTAEMEEDMEGNRNVIEIEGTRWERDFVADKYYCNGEECSRAQFEQAVGIKKSAKAGKKSTKKARSKDVGFEYVIDGIIELTLTTRQCKFLLEVSKCSCWVKNDGVIYTDVLMDECGWPGMSFGAMVSTLREKGLLVVKAVKRDNRRVKSIILTNLGREVVEAAGFRLPGC